MSTQEFIICFMFNLKRHRIIDCDIGVRDISGIFKTTLDNKQRKLGLTWNITIMSIV